MIFNNSNKNAYSWTKGIHTVMEMRIIVSTRRTISKPFGRPKTSSPSKCNRQFVKDDPYM
jgi:hypothetical protein